MLSGAGWILSRTGTGLEVTYEESCKRYVDDIQLCGVLEYDKVNLANCLFHRPVVRNLGFIFG